MWWAISKTTLGNMCRLLYKRIVSIEYLDKKLAKLTINIRVTLIFQQNVQLKNQETIEVS